MKKTQISFNVELDENKIPEKINWSAPDGGISNENSKAVFISVWNHNMQETFSFSLCTKVMPLDQLTVFFHLTLLSMRDTFSKFTQNEKLPDACKQFC